MEGLIIDFIISLLIGYKHTANSGWHSVVTSYLQAIGFMHVGVT